MASPKLLWPTIVAVLFVATVAYLVGNGSYEAEYLQVIRERDRAAGLLGWYTVPGGWAWFLLNVAAVIYGMIAWRYFGGWIAAPLVVLLCVLGGVHIDHVHRYAWTEVVPSQDFAWRGGTWSGLLSAMGVWILNLKTPRTRWTLQHLFAGMVAVACFFGGLKVYEWREMDFYRQYFGHIGSWPEGWQITDEDRRIHADRIERIEREERERGLSNSD